ncbi:helix-turn-helix domain-containing protein [Brevibacillus laterosporus]|uniref:helix-turn-helix domain-containing protein n=1 Tax=Brevibacillus laterosporus TaxID=1465 RepID=UPI003D243B6B
MSRKTLLTTEEIADYLKVDRRTIFRYVKEGLPVLKPTKRKNLYDIDKVHEWLEENKK